MNSTINELIKIVRNSPNLAYFDDRIKSMNLPKMYKNITYVLRESIKVKTRV